MFCVLLDNSGIKGEFYRNIRGMDSAQLLALYQSFITQPERFYYQNFDTGVNFGVERQSYQTGNYLRGKKSGKKFERDGKVFLQGSNQFGQCVKNRPIKFLEENEKASCGFKLKSFKQCANFNWKNQLFSDVSFSSLPSNTASEIKMKINSIYLKDFVTGEIREYIKKSAIDVNLNEGVFNSTFSFKNTLNNITQKYIYTNTSLINDTELNNNAECSCDYLLSDLQYTFVLDSTITSLIDILADVVLYYNIKKDCNSKITLKQSFSSKFSISVNQYISSGSPGYLIGSKLLVARNYTNSTSTYLQTQRNGFSLSGRNREGNCINSTTPISNDADRMKIFENNEDENVIYFGSNTEYTCKNDFTLAQLKDYCEKNLWKEFQIFKQVDYIQYLGRFGNADLAYFQVRN
jgi:hypothetical protein